MIDRLKLFLCTGGLGLLPKAPGTWGSLAPLLVLLTLGHFGVSPALVMGTLIAILLSASWVTIALATWYKHYFGKKDPPQVVCDEWAGQSIALLGMAWIEPENHFTPETWIALAILAFILFRVFDIWKPSLINTIQQLPKGWGVLLDDILAGIAAGILVSVAAIFLG